MGSATEHVRLQRGCSPFDLDDEASYQRWRAVKLGTQARHADDLIVDVADASALSVAERAALLQRCARWNMAIYRSAKPGADQALALRVGAQLGLHRLDANWLADEDGVSSITVSRPLPPSALRAVPPEGERAAWDGPAPRRDERGGFIPYTDKPIRWHTDGYYNPP